MSSEPFPSFQLYSFFRSTCSARVRTAAILKGIPLQYVYVNVPKEEHESAEYAAINPSRSVPTLSWVEGNGRAITVRQSVAILEFFEERFPDRRPLLPPASDILGRTIVRELVNIIANDIQPPTNRRILVAVRGLNGNADEWAKKLMQNGLRAFDKVAEKTAGIFSYGDQVTLADVALAPAMENAVRYGVDLDTIPTVKRIFNSIKSMEEFTLGDWKHQGDTPEELRAS